MQEMDSQGERERDRGKGANISLHKQVYLQRLLSWTACRPIQMPGKNGLQKVWGG